MKKIIAPDFENRMKQLTPQRRDLMLRVMDGHLVLKDLMWVWQNHPKKHRLDFVLKWLIQNNLTGFRLMAYCQAKPGTFNKLYDDICNKIFFEALR